MGSVSRWTEVTPDCLGVNPSHLGQFSNIFTNYSSLLSLQSYIEPNYLLWISWGISKIMGSVSGWTEVILRATGVHTDMWYYTTQGYYLKTSHGPINMRPEFHSLANPMGMGLWYCTTQGYDSKTSYWPVNMWPGFHSPANLMGMGLWYCTTQRYNSKSSHWPVNIRLGFHSPANPMGMDLWYCWRGEPRRIPRGRKMSDRGVVWCVDTKGKTTK